MRLRESRPDEYDAVGALTLAAYRDGQALHDPDAAYIVELTDAARRAREAELLVVEDAGALVATVTVCRPGSPWAEIARPGELELRMLAVAPQARGRGVARTVMSEVEREAGAEGYAAVVVSVIEGNRPAHRLYQGLGFGRVPERDWRPLPEVLLQVWTKPLPG